MNLTPFLLPLRFMLPALLVLYIIIINLYSYWYSIPQAQKQVELEVESNFLEIINRTQGTMRYLLQHEDMEGVVREISNLGAVEGFKLAMLFDDRNTVIASTRFTFLEQNLLKLDTELPHMNAASFEQAKNKQISEKHWTANHSLLTGYFPVPIGLSKNSLRSDRIGLLYVEFDATWRKNRISQILINQSIQISLFTTVLLLVLLILLHFSVTRRAARLVNSAREVSAGNLLSRTDMQGRDEMAMIGSAFDQMVVRLEREQHMLENSEKRLRAILDHTSDGIITLDQEGCIQSANIAAAKLFGYAVTQMPGLSIQRLMPELQHHDGFLQRYMAMDKASLIANRREMDALKSDGALIHIDFSVTEAELEGQRIFIGVLRDITERKKVERLREDFIAMVSHELRTPLTAIRGSLGLLNGGVLGDIGEQARSMVTVAHNNAERLTKLINDLLDIQKTEAGQLVFEFKELPISPLLTEAMTTNQPFASRTQVKLNLTSSLSNEEVSVDPMRFQQIMSNLISNACKFSQAGGTVDIEASMQDPLHVRVAVRDFGSGIPEDFRQRIFQKFSQADSSSTRAKEGTGLGLAICKELIMRMNGEIDFVSTLGEGTSFYFILTVLAPATA